MTVREFLTNHNAKQGFDLDDESLIESLREEGTEVKRSGQDQHRWYILQTVVMQIDDIFIEYKDYVITGDNSASDMGLEYDIDEAKIVERKERQIIEVYYE